MVGNTATTNDDHDVIAAVMPALTELVRLHPDLPLAGIRIAYDEVAIQVGVADGVAGVCRWAIRTDMPVRFTRYRTTTTECQASVTLPLGGHMALVWTGVDTADAVALLSRLGSSFAVDLDPHQVLAALAAGTAGGER